MWHSPLCDAVVHKQSSSSDWLRIGAFGGVDAEEDPLSVSFQRCRCFVGDDGANLQAFVSLHRETLGLTAGGAWGVFEPGALSLTRVKLVCSRQRLDTKVERAGEVMLERWFGGSDSDYMWAWTPEHERSNVLFSYCSSIRGKYQNLWYLLCSWFLISGGDPEQKQEKGQTVRHVITLRPTTKREGIGTTTATTTTTSSILPTRLGTGNYSTGTQTT